MSQVYYSSPIPAGTTTPPIVLPGQHNPDASGTQGGGRCFVLWWARNKGLVLPDGTPDEMRDAVLTLTQGSTVLMTISNTSVSNNTGFEYDPLGGTFTIRNAGPADISISIEDYDERAAR
jgi:hypothetical protein